MKASTMILMTTLLTVSGCGRKEPVPEATSPASALAEESAAASGTSAPVPQNRSSAQTKASAPSAAEPGVAELEGAIHPFMTSQLRLFIQQKGRMPESFAEFSAARLDSVPRPPPGMEYVIDASAQAVKVVRKAAR